MNHQIKDQTGKVVVITGCTSGIGLETASVLSQKGATLVMGCRNSQKAQKVYQELKKTSQGPIVSLPLDVSDLNSVKAFAAEVKARFSRLDVLIHNAAVMAVPYKKTAQGHESTFATNYLGAFALTAQLWELVLATPNARVITVSSLAHRYGQVQLDNLNAQKSFNKNKVYSQSKLANLLFAKELSRRIYARGVNASSIAVHPGWTITGLQAHTRLFTFLNPFFGQKPEQGAWPTLFAATDPSAKNGEYYGPSGCLELQGRPKLVQMSKTAQDAKLAKALWKISEELAGLRFCA